MATKTTAKGNRRPVEFVRHPDTGKPVDRLRFHKTSGRYYRIAADAKAREYYPRDGLQGVAYLRRAVYLHELWLEGKQPPDSMQIVETRQKMNPWVYPPQPTGETYTLAIDVKSDLFWTTVREELLRDRFAFAAKVGIPELAFLDKLRPSGLSLELEAIGNRYLNKTPSITDKEKREVKRFWKEFKVIVSVKTVDLITAEHIRQFRDTVNQSHKEGKSPTYVKRRFCGVKTVLSHALTEGEDTDNLQRALTLCKMLVSPKKVDSDPQPISREDFAKLLEKADPKWRAMLLLALNAAYYPIDLCQVSKSAIDLKTGTLRETRTKTGVPRIAILWQRTIEAIKAYMKAEPHKHDCLFVNEEGNPFNHNINRNYRRLRKRAGVAASVKFADIRDGAQTAAIEGGADAFHVDILLGHKTGQRDDYLKRKPTMVRDACKAIERYYFSQEEEKPKFRGKRTTPAKG